jgi:hypothetical protein
LEISFSASAPILIFWHHSVVAIPPRHLASTDHDVGHTPSQGEWACSGSISSSTSLPHRRGLLSRQLEFDVDHSQLPINLLSYLLPVAHKLQHMQSILFVYGVSQLREYLIN